mgnify:FL=1
MKVLDLFSGLGGFSQAFKDRGHSVTTYDNDSDFHADWICDIGDLIQLPIVDVILASPPCDCFSMMSLAKYWNKDNTSKNEIAEQSLGLVKHALKLIEESHPTFWVLENPRAKLRKLIGLPQMTVTWCQYGAKVQKMTDLWGNIPLSFQPRKCRNGDSCHIPAPRGSRTGTQNDLSSAERAKIPYGLSLELCLAMESEISIMHTTPRGS